MKKIILVSIAIVFFFNINFVNAEVIINEVQIAGASLDDEFIELYNPSSLTIDLTGWYIKKVINSSGNITKIVNEDYFEGKSILGNSYFLLTRANGYTGNVSSDIKWPNSYSLANNNSLILYRGNETDKNEVSWESIENDKSIQKTSNDWIIASPTPKAQNATSGTDSSNNDDSSSNNDNDEEDSEETETVIPVLKTKILAKTTAFVGQPVEFLADVKYGTATYLTGRFFWNF
ncbi:MAG: lamin tail domain-containing protein, partial [Candidatus Paceibacterota bacterium]